MLETTQKPLSLVGKLAQACQAVGGLEKLGHNEAQRYNYIKAADVAKAIRHELFSRGVVITEDEKEFMAGGEIATRNGGKLREFILKVEYTIRDADSTETITGAAFGVAMDSGDKAIYKCKTGALKYFLRGLGLIPDEKDDPEVKAQAPTAVDPDLPTKEERLAYVKQLKEFGKDTDSDVLRQFVLRYTGAPNPNKIKRVDWAQVLFAMDEAAKDGTLSQLVNPKEAA